MTSAINDNEPERRREDVLREIEGDYFIDYGLFSGAVRDYVAHSLEIQYNSDKNDGHRRLFALAVFREEYTSYEDLGAMLQAFVLAAGDDTAVPLDAMIRYKPGRVVLQKIFKEHAIATGADLYAKLALDAMIPPAWPTR